MKRSAGDPVLLMVVNVSWAFISHRLSLAIAARAAGYVVHVATEVRTETERRKIIEAGIILHDIRVRRNAIGPYAVLDLLVSLIRLYRRVNPDIVHLVTMKPNVLGGWAARICRVPAVVYAVAGLGFTFTAVGVKAKLQRAMLSVALRVSFGHRNSRVIFQNPDDSDLLVDAGILRADRAVLIRGAGVDLVEFPELPEPHGPVRVLLATRLLREKGVPEYAAAAQELQRSGVPAEFLLAGDLDNENPGSCTRDEIENWERTGAFRWLGHVSAMPSLLADVHIVTLPSYYREGIPRVLIEAAAAGRAIVTTDMPGCREIVKHKLNGLLVPPRDSRALAEALRSLIVNTVERKRMGAASRERVVAEFTLQQVIARTLQLYAGLRANQG